jgi:two-component system sensor histidine kinase ArlS
MSQIKPNKQSQHIARSLTLSYFFSLLSLLFVVNLIFGGILLYVMVSEAEEQIALQRSLITYIDGEWIFPQNSNNISFEKNNYKEDTRFINALFIDSSMSDVTSRRLFAYERFDLSHPHTYHFWKYQVQWIENNQPVTGTIRLNSTMPKYLVLFAGLLMLQLGFILYHTIKQSFRIRKQLHPLNVLSTSTKDLKKDITQLAVSVDMNQLNSITKAIEKIDAYKLDNPIQIKANSQELAALTETINEMLVRINQAVILQTEFVSNASHELRTPISVIQGYVNLLDRWGKNDPATLQESIDAIKDETENMKILVENLLFLARGDSDNIQLMLEQVHVRVLFEEIIKETALIDQDKKVNIHCDESISMLADRQLIKQAIRIVMDNALKYSIKDATIFMRASIQDKELVISITDEGIGISPQSIDKVFDRFYRDEQARVIKTKGAGLGLSIAKWIVQKHQGNIQIVSRQNIGTKVSITLPILNR